MLWLKALLQALGEIFKAWNVQQQQEAGRNKEKLDNLNEIEKRGKDADKVRESDISDDDVDSYLLMHSRKPKSNSRKLPRV